MTTRQTLTVFCVAGLANRLRVLVSGIAAAEISGRGFKMIWPRTRHCAAAYRELFTNNWSVTDVEKLDPALTAQGTLPGSPLGTIQQLVADPRQDIVVGSFYWIVNCDPLEFPELHTRCCELLSELKPLPEIRNQITEIKQQFRSTMIGVHLRRGDFLRIRPDKAWNTRAACKVVDRLLVETPDAGIFLCTDDGAVDQRTGRVHYEGIRETFRKRYGDRVISTKPRSLDRRNKDSVQDAMVDLWLLRSMKRIVGTSGSSFSNLAAYGREVEFRLVGNHTPAYAIIHFLAVITGIHWLVIHSYRKLCGEKRPFPVAWSQLRRSFRKH